MLPGIAFHSVTKHLYPMIGLATGGARVKTRFGVQPPPKPENWIEMIEQAVAKDIPTPPDSPISSVSSVSGRLVGHSTMPPYPLRPPGGYFDPPPPPPPPALLDLPSPVNTINF